MSAWELGPYRAIDHHFLVRGHANARLRERIESTLSPLATDALPHSLYEVVQRDHPKWERYEVSFQGSVLTTTPSAATAAGYLQWHVNQEALRRNDGRYLVLHAAAVQRVGVTVLLPAASNSGKSTTAAGLIRAGFSYATDEAVAIDPDSLLISAYPKSLSLDLSSIELLGDVSPPTAHSTTSEAQWHVPPHLLGDTGTFSGARPDVIVLPQYQEGAPTELISLTPGLAAFELADSTFNFPDYAARNLRVIAHLAETCPAYRLIIGDLGDAVSVISDLVRQYATPHMESQS